MCVCVNFKKMHNDFRRKFPNKIKSSVKAKTKVGEESELKDCLKVVVVAGRRVDPGTYILYLSLCRG